MIWRVNKQKVNSKNKNNASEMDGELAQGDNFQIIFHLTKTRLVKKTNSFI